MSKLTDGLAGASGVSADDGLLYPRRILPSLLAAVAFFLCGIAVLLYLDNKNQQRHLEQETEQVRFKLSLLKNGLESALDQRLFIGQGLEALVKSQQDITPGDFNMIARVMLAGRTGIRNLTLARDNIVTHVFPEEGNRAALGLDLMSRPDQAAAIRGAVDKRSMVLAGPFALVQGGSALAARAPVFMPVEGGTQRYWGLVSVLIEADVIFDESGFRTATDHEGIRVAVRGRDGKGAAGAMVWGEQTLFDERPVALDMPIPGGSWRLGAVPSRGWTADYAQRSRFWILGLPLLAALSVLSGLFVSAAARFRFQFEGREEVKRELTESEERFRRLAEAAWEGLVIHDRQHIYDFNRRLVEMTGYSPDDIKRMSILDLIDSDDPEYFQNSGSGAGLGQREISLCCKGGRTILAEVRGADLFFRGRLLHVSSLRDITATKEAERALVAARDAAQMANRVKSEFLANMSHELRTPLNAVIGFAEIMEQEILGPLGTPRYKAYVHDIQLSARHLLDIINDILDISRLEAGSLDLFETVFDLASTARACLRLLEARAAKNNCSLVLDLPGQALPAVCADERRMKQILLNLLSNAVKFTPEGGEVRLSLRLDTDGAMRLTVADTGIGMTEDDIKKALTPFMQVDSGMNRRQEGTGLGLPLAKNMVELHGGTMLVESEPGQGTQVIVRLPPNRVKREQAGLPPVKLPAL
ncbi:MAG: CHASE domain-containing protein [Alphaproteobacteria bacterium]|nr:CHASE domain-containing protein [Alphaproteobacteria bacterium]